MSNNRDTIYNFFRAKGLTSAQAYGILGNAMAESSLNPSALNGNEGAIGIFQWEGGRRSALQNYARQHGGSESDLTTQLNFAWHELTTSESGALSQLRGAGSVASAAAAWDVAYERSSGSSRQQRISYAEQFASGQGPSGGTSGGSHFSGAESGGTRALTSGQYQQALGTLSGIITHVPELKGLLQHALRSGQTTEDFVNSVQNSKWYKTHSDTYRTMFSLQYSNPGEYRRQTGQSVTSIVTQAEAMGVRLTKAQAQSIAHSVLWNGLDQTATQRAIAGLYVRDGGIRGTQHGVAAQTVNQLNQLVQEYGLPVTSTWLNNYTKNILQGTDTIDGARNNLVQQAQSLYPSIANQLKEGQTVKDVAQPYIAQMAQTLELPDSKITLHDPTIKGALQYQPTDPTGKAQGAQTLMPLNTFENHLRQDPRWDQTDNAKQSALGMLHQLGQSFGFAS